MEVQVQVVAARFAAGTTVVGRHPHHSRHIPDTTCQRSESRLRATSWLFAVHLQSGEWPPPWWPWPQCWQLASWPVRPISCLSATLSARWTASWSTSKTVLTTNTRRPVDTARRLARRSALSRGMTNTTGTSIASSSPHGRTSRPFGRVPKAPFRRPSPAPSSTWRRLQRPALVWRYTLSPPSNLPPSLV